MHKELRTYAIAALIVAVAGSHAAVTISKDVNDPAPIPGLTGFATTGAMMTGMSVKATFSGNSFSETLAWSKTGANSGSVDGTGWGLSLSGDTFTAAWNFTFDANTDLGQLTSLILSGSPGLTVFDTTEPATNGGSPGSAQGRDFEFFNGTCGSCEATAVYSEAVKITPNDPVGDLFHLLTVTFVTDTSGASTGPSTNWSFRQDTDNDSRINQTPEPGSVALAALALLALGAVRRRRAQ